MFCCVIESEAGATDCNKRPMQYFKCDHCDKVFKYKSHYLRHLSTHNNEHEHKCPTCSTEFKRLDSLNRHRIKHTEQKYVCDQCQNCYSDRASLTYHYKHKHQWKDHLFVCKVCGKAFATEKNLKYHLNSHAKLMKFKCEQCPAEFCNPWGKSRHKKEKVIN